MFNAKRITHYKKYQYAIMHMLKVFEKVDMFGTYHGAIADNLSAFKEWPRSNNQIKYFPIWVVAPILPLFVLLRNAGVRLVRVASAFPIQNPDKEREWYMWIANIQPGQDNIKGDR